MVCVCVVWAQGRPLQAGDRLRLSSGEEPSLNGERAVSAAGTLRAGILGSVAVGGLTAVEAESVLRRLLRERRPETRGDVRVLLLSGSDPFVTYGGAVEFSGRVLAESGMTLADIVRLAKPTVAADLSRVRITAIDGAQRWIAYRPGQGGSEHNPPLRAGERVFFELATGTADVFVLGGVARPRNVPLRDAPTVALAIEACGGLITHANPLDVTVWRDGTVVERLTTGRAGEVNLRAGDTVRVGLVDDRTYVTVLGAVWKPGRIAYREGMDYRSVLLAAGGLRGEADLEDAVVKTGAGERKAGAKELATVGFQFAPGDLLEIPPAIPGSPKRLAARLALAIGRLGS